MTLDRRVLAKVDRRLLSEMDHTDGVQLVKVPVSDAVWSTWRRYCDTLDLTMGRGLAILLHHELASVVDEDVEQLAATLKKREASTATQETELAQSQQELKRRETEVAAQERRLAAAVAKASRTQPKQGRNETCWCNSGKKFKYCHGRTTR